MLNITTIDMKKEKLPCLWLPDFSSIILNKSDGISSQLEAKWRTVQLFLSFIKKFTILLLISSLKAIFDWYLIA